MARNGSRRETRRVTAACGAGAVVMAVGSLWAPADRVIGLAVVAVIVVTVAALLWTTMTSWVAELWTVYVERDPTEGEVEAWRAQHARVELREVGPVAERGAAPVGAIVPQRIDGDL